MKWSDLWSTPRRLLITIIILLCIYGMFTMGIEGFLDAILYILINKGIPIAVVIALILLIVRLGKGK